MFERLQRGAVRRRFVRSRSLPCQREQGPLRVGGARRARFNCGTAGQGEGCQSSLPNAWTKPPIRSPTPCGQRMRSYVSPPIPPASRANHTRAATHRCRGQAGALASIPAPSIRSRNEGKTSPWQASRGHSSNAKKGNTYHAIYRICDTDQDMPADRRGRLEPGRRGSPLGTGLSQRRMRWPRRLPASGERATEPTRPPTESPTRTATIGRRSRNRTAVLGGRRTWARSCRSGASKSPGRGTRTSTTLLRRA